MPIRRATALSPAGKSADGDRTGASDTALCEIIPLMGQEAAGPAPSDVIEIVAIPPRPERTGLAKVFFVGWVLDILAGGGWWFVSGSGSRQTRVVVRYHR